MNPTDVTEDGYYWIFSSPTGSWARPDKFIALKEGPHWYCCGVQDPIEDKFVNGETVVCHLDPPDVSKLS